MDGLRLARRRRKTGGKDSIRAPENVGFCSNQGLSAGFELESVRHDLINIALFLHAVE